MKIRTLFLPFACLIMTIVAAACHGNEIYDEMPQDIQMFISRYFPNSEVQSFTHSASSYYVRIDDGPGMTFDQDYKWTSLNGYGLPLPQMFLFDQLPEKVYDYLQETSQLNSVFEVERTAKEYSLKLMHTTITYDIATGQLSGTVPQP